MIPTGWYWVRRDGSQEDETLDQDQVQELIDKEIPASYCWQTPQPKGK